MRLLPKDPLKGMGLRARWRVARLAERSQTIRDPYDAELTKAYVQTWLPYFELRPRWLRRMAVIAAVLSLVNPLLQASVSNWFGFWLGLANVPLLAWAYFWSRRFAGKMRLTAVANGWAV